MLHINASVGINGPHPIGTSIGSVVRWRPAGEVTHIDNVIHLCGSVPDAWRAIGIARLLLTWMTSAFTPGVFDPVFHLCRLQHNWFKMIRIRIWLLQAFMITDHLKSQCCDRERCKIGRTAAVEEQDWRALVYALEQKWQLSNWCWSAMGKLVFNHL